MTPDHLVLVRADDPCPIVVNGDDGSLSLRWPEVRRSCWICSATDQADIRLVPIPVDLPGRRAPVPCPGSWHTDDLDKRAVTDDWPRFVAISRELLEAWVAELSAHRVAEQRRDRRWWRRVRRVFW